MLSSNLFRKIFFSISIIILLSFLVIYLIAIPFIKDTIYNLEEDSAKTILNSMHDLVKSEHFNMEEFRKSELESYKMQLKNITLIQESFLKNKYDKYKKGLLTKKQAQKEALEELRKFRYGKNDYLWVSNYQSVLISHPDDGLHNTDFSEVRDVYGNLIVPPMVEVALKNGEGYTSYWWRRLGEEKPVEKLTFSKNFKPWNWVIGTGVYIDDVEAKIVQRRQRVIEYLRQAIRKTKIARTGYLYIFDAKMNMVAHPNSNIEGTDISSLLDPVTQKSIGYELMEVSKLDDPKLYYKWDKPNDDGNYVYDKISWVKYLNEFDWYIASSVYLEEINSGAEKLGNRIIMVFLGVFIFLITIVIFWVNGLIKPIRTLSETADRIKKGDLSARSEVSRKDEIGFLADAFNEMVKNLQSHVDNLDSKVRERTLALEKAYDELKKLDKIKTDFLSAVSHELRTPLTSILGFSNMIQKKLEMTIAPLINDDNQKGKKAIERIDRNIGIIISESERLTALINDVLDIAKLEAGKIEWKKEMVSIGSIINQAVNATSALIDNKRLEISQDVPDDLPDLEVDRNRIIQVVINLISNSVKFTEEGSIICRARKIDDQIVVSILDTGIGIPESELMNVFDKFKQVGDTLTDKPTGTGLGLSICKQIVEYHQGTVGVKRRAEGGSEFFFNLPVKSINQPFELKLEVKDFVEQIPEFGITTPDTNGEKKNIMVVDDEANICELLKLHLQDKGYGVTIATDSVEAVRLAKKNHPDLITLDIRMPKLDGFDVAAVLKNNPITKNIPIIVISVEEDSERGYLIGVDKHLVKPVNIDELLKEVDTLTGR